MHPKINKITAQHVYENAKMFKAKDNSALLFNFRHPVPAYKFTYQITVEPHVDNTDEANTITWRYHRTSRTNARPFYPTKEQNHNTPDEAVTHAGRNIATEINQDIDDYNYQNMTATLSAEAVKTYFDAVKFDDEIDNLPSTPVEQTPDTTHSNKSAQHAETQLQNIAGVRHVLETAVDDEIDTDRVLSCITPVYDPANGAKHMMPDIKRVNVTKEVTIYLDHDLGKPQLRIRAQYDGGVGFVYDMDPVSTALEHRPDIAQTWQTTLLSPHDIDNIRWFLDQVDAALMTT